MKLPIQNDPKWLNMKEVEPDKLEWMQDVKGDIHTVMLFQHKDFVQKFNSKSSKSSIFLSFIYNDIELKIPLGS